MRRRFNRNPLFSHLFNAHQMVDFRQHSPNFRSVLVFNRLIHPPESERDHYALLRTWTTDYAPDLRDFKSLLCLFLAHLCFRIPVG